MISRLWAMENKRNEDNADIFTAVIREAFDNVLIAVAGHHLIFTQEGRPDAIEIPSADYLIFNHLIAKKIWGDGYLDTIVKLALEPVATRDALFRRLYLARVR